MLLPEADRLRQLNRRFGASVIPALADACQVGALRDGTAIIYCRHGAAAARVRSQGASIARALNSAELPVEKVTVKVRADWARPTPAEKAGLDDGALEAWRRLSGDLPDGDLKQAVRQLLRHHRE
jgi:hypothetical protein